MRKLLYGTSALVAAGLLHVDPAFAQAKESPVTLTVGGRFNFMYAFSDQDENSGTGAIRDHGIIREAEILFRGRTALNNGLRVGVHVGLEAETCLDQIDESYIWFEHDSFGRLEAGSTDQVGWKMFYGAPTVIPNYSLAQINTRVVNASNVNAAILAPQALLNLGNDAEHLNYFTPRFFGFQVGVSYTPENCQEAAVASVTTAAPSSTCTGAVGLPSNANPGQQGNIWEIAGNFVQKFGEFNIGLFGAYANGDLETPGPTAVKDQKQWSVGGNVAAYGFTFGAHYKNDNLGQAGVDYDSYGVGLTYRWDAWTFGVDYSRTRADNATAGVANGTRDKMWQVDLGVQWAGMGPGINMFAGVQFFDFDARSPAVVAAGAPSNDGTNFIIGTTITY